MRKGISKRKMRQRKILESKYKFEIFEKISLNYFDLIIYFNFTFDLKIMYKINDFINVE